MGQRSRHTSKPPEGERMNGHHFAIEGCSYMRKYYVDGPRRGKSPRLTGMDISTISLEIWRKLCAYVRHSDLFVCTRRRRNTCCGGPMQAQQRRKKLSQCYQNFQYAQDTLIYVRHLNRSNQTPPPPARHPHMKDAHRKI